MMFFELLLLLQRALWAECRYFFFVPVGVLATIWADYQRKHEEALDRMIQENGIATEGQIIDHEKTARTYYLVYRYEYQGESYTQKQRVYPLGYESVTIGDTVPIRFLSEMPSLSLITAIQKKNTYTRKVVSTLLIITVGYTSFVCFGVIAGVLAVYFSP